LSDEKFTKRIPIIITMKIITIFLFNEAVSSLYYKKYFYLNMRKNLIFVSEISRPVNHFSHSKLSTYS